MEDAVKYVQTCQEAMSVPAMLDFNWTVIIGRLVMVSKFAQKIIVVSSL